MAQYMVDLKRVLRHYNDSFTVQYFSESFSAPREGGQLKPCLVFCTSLTFYVVKKKDFKVYHVVPLRLIEKHEIKNRSFHISYVTNTAHVSVEVVGPATEMDTLLKTMRQAIAALTPSRGNSPATTPRSKKESYRSESDSAHPLTSLRMPTAPTSKIKQNALGANRLLIVKSMVESDFNDCGALRTAYVVGNEADVQSDIKLYMEENRKEMFALCVHEHERFLNAIEVGGTIEDEALDHVQEQSAAVSDVVGSVLALIEDHKNKVTESSRAIRNISRAYDEILDTARLLQMVSSVGEAIKAKNYYTAITSLQELLGSTRQLALPHKVVRSVVQTHIPALRQSLEKEMKDDTNMWLVKLRDQSASVGKTLMDQFGCKRTLRVKRSVAAHGETWQIQDVDEPTEIVNTFLMKEILPVVEGMVLQRTYKLVGWNDFFGPYIRAERRKQFIADLENLRPFDFAAQFESWFHRLCGIMVTDDVLANSFDPPLCSAAELHSEWEQSCNLITPLLKAVTNTQGSNSELLSRLLNEGLKFVGTIMECVRSTQLNYVPIQDKLNEIRNKLVDIMAAEYNGKFADALAADSKKESFVPVTVKKAAEYDDVVTKLLLQYHPIYKFPAFTQGEVRLPFTSVIPNSAAVLFEFIRKIGELCSYTSTPDDRVLSHLSVMLSSVPGTLQKRAMSFGQNHSLQLAMLVVNASYFAYLVNVVEGMFSVISSVNVYGSYRFYEPGPWLRDTFQEFVSTIQVLEQKLLECLVSRVNDLFDTINPASQWTPSNKAVDKVNHFSDILLFLDTVFLKMEHHLGGGAIISRYRTDVLKHIVEKLIKIAHQIGLTATNGAFTEEVLGNFEADAKVLVEFAEKAQFSVESFRQSLVVMHNHCSNLIDKENKRKAKEKETAAGLLNFQKTKQDFVSVFKIFGRKAEPASALIPPRSPVAAAVPPLTPTATKMPPGN
eukprot:PhF_6_TR42689/c0_g1_i1/m.64406/K19985/EXOC6, SEC15; exocyst complex component 6